MSSKISNITIRLHFISIYRWLLSYFINRVCNWLHVLLYYYYLFICIVLYLFWHCYIQWLYQYGSAERINNKQWKVLYRNWSKGWELLCIQPCLRKLIKIYLSSIIILITWGCWCCCRHHHFQQSYWEWPLSSPWLFAHAAWWSV
jgi:hypothetical protein